MRLRTSSFGQDAYQKRLTQRSRREKWLLMNDIARSSPKRNLTSSTTGKGRMAQAAKNIVGIWADNEGAKAKYGHEAPIHFENDCYGKRCAYHNPTQHACCDLPVKYYVGGTYNPNTDISTQTVIVYRQCKHGELHPDPDEVARLGEYVMGGHFCPCKCCTKQPAQRGR